MSYISKAHTVYMRAEPQPQGLCQPSPTTLRKEFDFHYRFCGICELYSIIIIILVKIKIKSVAYSSQGSHSGQLDFCM